MLLMPSIPGAVGAQIAPPAPEPAATPSTTASPWIAGVSWGREVMRGSRPGWPDWSEARLFATRRFERGSLGAEVARVERFGSADVAVAVDGYRELWAGSYGHVRVRATPDAAVLPGLDTRLEVFQALPGGWELAAHARAMDFETEDVASFGVGVARYVGAWYLRQITSLSRLAGASAVSGAAVARRFLAPPHEYVEFAGGVGSEVVLVGAGPTLDTRETRFVQVRAQRFVAVRWGLTVGLGYTTFEGAPSRVGASAGVLVR